MFEFERYSQTDPRWKNVRLGFDNESTIGGFGCLLTCVTMAATGFGYAETPASLNEKLKALGPNVGFMSAMLVWGGIARALPGVTLRRLVDCDNPPAPLADIDAALAAGFPVIVEVDYENKPGYQYHWLILYGKKDGDYLLQDPYPYPASAQETLLTQSRYAFAGAPDRIITGAAFLEGPIRKAAPPPAESEPAEPASGRASRKKVYVIEADLALRSSPNVEANNLIKRLPLMTELSSLEPADQTRGKIGVVGQWLKVREPNGDKGYVAAWYLAADRQALAPAVPGGPVISTTTAAGALLVRTTTADVALRSQPVLGDHTLLKRLPFNAKLTVLEPAADAARKIGVVSQWLKVRDTTGMEGFIAAWYVAAATA
ncbi:MAG TPA: SH3 domain-containing protein [Anaerolineae bacterium]|nr:SH3 domain-containing protein [Anaerolineae bacterium]